MSDAYHSNAALIIILRKIQMFRKTASIIAAIFLLQPYPGAAAKTELLPEVAAILHDIQIPDEMSLKQNVFVGLLGMHAPADMDYMAIGSEVVLNNIDYLKRALAKEDMSSIAIDRPNNHFDGRKELALQPDIDGQRYLFPCFKAGNYNCIEETLAQKDDIALLTRRQTTLMQRYLQIREMPNWKAYAYNAADPIPAYSTVTFLSYLRIAQAILSFDMGRADEGFNLLQAEMTFTKKMLSQSESLIEKMIAARLLYVNYHVISELLDTPSMQPYLDDDRLNELLAPLTDNEQKALAKSFTFERNVMLYLLNTVDAEKAILSGFPETEACLDQTDTIRLSEQYDPEATNNIFYLMYEPAIKRASLPLQKVSALYIQNALNSLKEQALHILHKTECPK